MATTRPKKANRTAVEGIPVEPLGGRKLTRIQSHADRVHAIRGKYAFVRGSSEDFIREKTHELAREG